MRVVRRLDEAKALCRDAARRGRLGLVPTMGALHAGHLALVRRARAESDAVAVTIFVNPLQFGPHEDFERYPHTEERDAELLRDERADLLLLLQRDEMYPQGFATRIDQAGLARVLEGAVRPDHFRGVLTVVAKLLNIAGAQRAYFGRKDYQQTVVVRRLAADLDLPTEIVVCDTVRDADGLALSSRNACLSAGERQAALALSRALEEVERHFERGERSARALRAALATRLASEAGLAVDYAVIAGPDDLVERGDGDPATAGDVALVAARAGRTRLIDNHVLGAKIGPFFQEV